MGDNVQPNQVSAHRIDDQAEHDHTTASPSPSAKPRQEKSGPPEPMGNRKREKRISTER
jgi:hypothetical protein